MLFQGFYNLKRFSFHATQYFACALPFLEPYQHPVISRNQVKVRLTGVKVNSLLLTTFPDANYLRYSQQLRRREQNHSYLCRRWGPVHF